MRTPEERQEMEDQIAVVGAEAIRLIAEEPGRLIGVLVSIAVGVSGEQPKQSLSVTCRDGISSVTFYQETALILLKRAKEKEGR